MRRRPAAGRATARHARAVPLSRLVTPADTAVRSTNIERDRAGAASLGAYVADASVVDAVQRLAGSMRGGGRAFSVTGPYGSGKSTLAVLLGGLLGPSRGAEWRYAHRLLREMSPAAAAAVTAGRRALGAHAGGFYSCPIVAAREPVAASVVRALDRGARARHGARYSGRDFAGAGALRRLAADVGQARRPAGGADTGEIMGILRAMCARAPVAVTIDEFGKNLEYAADGEGGDGDLFLLQSMAEAGEGAGALPLLVITMQHMSFEEYGSRMPGARRREWAKVQGRFEDIPLSISAGQARAIVAGSLRRGGGAAGRAAAVAWASGHMDALRRLGLAGGLGEDLLASCYPLHPLSLLVLPELCARYGQHGRTLVSFVAGGGRGAVPWFVDGASWGAGALPSMGLESLYDYFVSGHQPAGPASAANVTRLMEVTSVIRDSRGLSAAAAAALRVIATLNLVSASGPLRASRDVIGYAVGPGAGAALAELESRSIVTHRGHADEYRVWRGTDFDIQAAMDVLRARHAGVPLAQTLARVVSPEPVVAARHGLRTGTMRIFAQAFLGAGAAEAGHDGAILYMTEPSAGIPAAAGPGPAIVVRPAGDMGRIGELAVETAAIAEMLEGDEAVRGDWVARRELWDRLSHGVTSIESGLARAYGEGSEWWLVHGDAGPRRLAGTGGAAASEAADIAYPESPTVHNEMINRNTPSMQASRARLRLITAMVAHPGEEGLGISGWGPDRAMYESILKKTGIHAKRGAGWTIGEPRAGLRSAWRSVMSSIESSRRRRVGLAEVYAALQAPPIGAKAGMLPVVTVAALLARRGDVALYEHGTYRPALAPEVIERLLKNPAHFEIKLLSGRTGAKGRAVRAVAAELGLGERETSLLGVVSALVRAAGRLPGYTRATSSLRARDRAVRDALLSATEPDVLLFEALPRALDVRLSSDGFAPGLVRSVRALEAFYPGELRRISGAVLEATRMSGRDRLAAVASSLAGRSTGADARMRGFLGALGAGGLDGDEWAAYVGMSLTDAPVADWGDESRKAFDARLREAADGLLRLVALNFADTAGHLGESPPPFRVTVTRRDGSEAASVAVASERDERAADEAVAKMLHGMRKRRGGHNATILALMASLGKRLR
ncbi:MAG: hypothetical protein OXU86_02150 [Thaumarchaeota archaeon]|nr:hypothetical protein [Nitrososphaerota archaeon]